MPSPHGSGLLRMRRNLIDHHKSDAIHALPPISEAACPFCLAVVSSRLDGQEPHKKAPRKRPPTERKPEQRERTLERGSAHGYAGGVCMWWWSVAIQLRKHAETATEPTAVIFFHSFCSLFSFFEFGSGSWGLKPDRANPTCSSAWPPASSA